MSSAINRQKSMYFYILANNNLQMRYLIESKRIKY